MALADACDQGRIPATLVLVMSDVRDAGVLARARERGVPAEFIDPGSFRSKLDDEAEAAMVRRLREAGVDYVVLAGFMRILSAGFLARLGGKVMNIHPSLLPSFQGTNTHQRALQDGVKIHGCTVHFVTPSVDSGPIIVQCAVPVLPDDTEEVLAARVLNEEHRILPRAVRWFLDGRLSVQGNHVLLAGELRYPDPITSPLTV